MTAEREEPTTVQPGDATTVQPGDAALEALQELEKHRRDAELRYRALVERLPAIVYIESIEGGGPEPGRMLYVSPQVERILGFTPAEWLDDPTAWSRQFHPEDKARVRAEYDRAIKTGEPFTAEYRMFSRDGRVTWFRDDALLVRDEHGAPIFWQGVMYDITDQRASEERAQGSEASYRALIEQIPAIVYTEPIGGQVLQISYISPRVEEILGIGPDEWMRNPDTWLAAIHPDDRDRVRKQNEHADRTQEPFTAEYRIRSRDDRELWFHDEARLVRDEHGNPLHWQGVMLDISNQRRAAELEQDLRVERETAQRLREVDEMKNTFLQAVSHDLRTPLAAILGLAVTLGREDVEMDAHETREMAARIAANARKLDRLVSDLLDLDRLSRGLVEPVLRPTDVGALVHTLAEDFELSSGRELDLDIQPVVIPVDATKVERIVENLLANTVKHVPAGTHVWVRVRPHGGGALIEVADDGPGVPPELRAQIFEPFRRGPTSPEHSPGVGIGLSLVARFTELHGGRVSIEDREGGGALFKVFLPGTPPAPPAFAAGPSS